MNARPVPRVSPDVERRLKELAERRLTPDEIERWLGEPIEGEELENLRRLIRWFKRHYSTPLERLRYSKRKYRVWTRQQGSGAAPGDAG